jgi:hypothetical protein
MQPVEIAATYQISTTFPELPNNCVSRDHLLDSLEDIYESGYDTILVDGPLGSGKTILLAQFAIRHANQSFSAFVRASSRWGHDPQLVQADLCNQINWVLTGFQIPSDSVPDASAYRELLFRLQRHIRATRHMFYFILDGMDELPDPNSHVIPTLIDLLPFGYQNCRFLIAGGRHAELVNSRPAIRVKGFWPSNFTTTEVREFFSAHSLTPADLTDLHTVCRGFPGKLASAQRLMARGASVTSLMDSDGAANIFATEARAVDQLSPKDKLLVAAIAHDPITRTIGELSLILLRDERDIETRVRELTFFTIGAESRQVTFASEILRNLIAQKLSSLSRQVDDAILSYILADPDSANAAREAPIYFDRSGQPERLLEFLTASRFERLFERDQSLTFVRERGDRCLAIATQLRRVDSAVRMSLQQSALRSVDQSSVWRPELDALLAAEETSSALALATSLFLKEDRLHGLAIYARHTKRQKRVLDGEVEEQIATLAHDIDFSKLGNRATEIAADLIFAMPATAIRIAEQSQVDDTHSRDWHLLKITSAGHAMDAESAKSLDGLRGRIGNPVLRLLSTHASKFVGDFSADSVLSEVETLDKGEDRLFLLKAWTQVHYKATDAIKVVNAAIDLFVRVGEYQPTIVDLRHIAAPLAHARASDELSGVISRIIRQAKALEAVGPSEEYVRLQLLIARGQTAVDSNAALERLVDVYLYISEVDEPNTKASCLAWLLRALPDIDSNEVLEARDHLHSMVRDELSHLVSQLLADTAQHMQVLRPIVEALAKHHIDIALNYVPSVNTQERRDAVLREVLDASIHTATAPLNLCKIIQALSIFVNVEMRDTLVAHLVETILKDHTSFSDVVGDVHDLLGWTHQIADPTTAATALSSAYCVLSRLGAPETTLAALAISIDQRWSDIGDSWDKVDAAYTIATALAPYSLDLAKKFIGAARNARAELTFDSLERCQPYLYSTRLAIRLYRALMPSNSDTDDDLKRIVKLILRVPSVQVRADLFNDVATSFYAAGRADNGGVIVARHLKPLLEVAQTTPDIGERSAIMSAIAPAHVRMSPLSVVDFDTISPAKAEAALDDAAEFVFTGLPRRDPYDSHYFAASLTYDALLNLLNIIERMYSDDVIYSWIVRLLPEKGHKITTQQQIEFSRRMDELIERKLPTTTGVQHDGYKIVSRARLFAFNRIKTVPDWERLVNAAAALTNAADRAFVRSTVASEMPQKLEAQRSKLVMDALADIQQIPSPIDKIDRYALLAQDVQKFDPANARGALKLAMEVAGPRATREHERAYRKVLDVANRIDPTYARALAQMLDNDPVRASLRARLNDHVRTLETKKHFIDGQWNLTGSVETAAKAAWMSLNSLNSGRMQTLQPEVSSGLLALAGHHDLEVTYPMIALTVAAVAHRYSRSDPQTVARQLRPVFEASMNASDFVYKVTTRESARGRTVVTPLEESGMIHSGERDKAFEQIAEWLCNVTPEYIKICDPYFGPQDFDLVRLIRNHAPDCRIEILTSRAHHDSMKLQAPYDSVYRAVWLGQISDEPLPGVDVMVVGTAKDGRLPIHDRWYVTSGSGLRIGTSVSGIGARRTTEISAMTPEAAQQAEAEIDLYLSRQRRVHDGERILYTVFTV